MKVLVTGGAGFIGSAVVRQYITETDTVVINVDKLTYVGNTDSLATVIDNSRHIFERVDICDQKALTRLVQQYQPDAVMHLAAESHVDRSIQKPEAFIETNIVGTYSLLETARSYCKELPSTAKSKFRFHHISTDEVYGDLRESDPPFTEETPYAPSSPYSASKASSDHLVRAWHRTYGLPVVLTNCSNNYGPYQFPDKLMPLMILNALEGKELPVYGTGSNIRDWLYVEDHARALRLVLAEGQVGETYNIGGRSERTNLEVVKSLCSHLDVLAPRSTGPYEQLIRFVPDRPGHDRRYAIDDSRITRDLGWQPIESFETGLKKTVEWYLNNPQWIESVKTGAYREWLQTNYAARGAGK